MQRMRVVMLALVLGLAGARDLQTVEELFSSETGLKSVPPSPDGSPLKVHVGFYMESLGSIRASEMVNEPSSAAPELGGGDQPDVDILEASAFDMDMYFRVNWRDTRLKHNGTLKLLTKENAKNIWYPDLFFANAKTAAYQTVTMPNFAVYVHPDGSIAYSSRIILNLACNLDLKQYPLDEQVCHVKIMSYAMPAREMDVTWFSDRPLSFNADIDLPEFQLTALEPSYCDGRFRYALTEERPNEGEMGNFSCLIAELFLKRSLGYHIVQTYIPTGLIVVISWIGFWIDSSAVPARISLSFTTLLTLATQGAGIRFAIPAVSYAKAIDFWFGTCMLFVFAALIEFAVVNSLMRTATKLSNLAQSMEQSWEEDETPSSPRQRPAKGMSAVAAPHLLPRRSSQWPRAMQNYGNFAGLSKKAAKKALKVDVVCRVMFPATFFFFNCIYWTYYSFF